MVTWRSIYERKKCVFFSSIILNKAFWVTLLRWSLGLKSNYLIHINGSSASDVDG